MNPVSIATAHFVQSLLTSHYWRGDELRSRTVSGAILSGMLDLPLPSRRLEADWERDTHSALGNEGGNVEALSLVRTRARWPELKSCVIALSSWMHSQGMADVLAASDMALMACRGTRYHHDGARYGGSAFCNLFLSEDKGLDVHFPVTGHRIPLKRGTVVVFDTCQPHAVVPRDSSAFDPAYFAPGVDCTQVFLTWELPMEDPDVARELGVSFDIDKSASHQTEEQLWLNGRPAELDADSGRWLMAD